MPYGYLDLASTPSVKAAQERNGSRKIWAELKADRPSDRFTASEAAFIRLRDSFYMATVSETGWPYVQHRGGPIGLLRVLDERTLGFADFRGNRQYISVGNLAADARTALFLMDYPNRTRLKILARAEVTDVSSNPELAARLRVEGYPGKVERAMLFHLEAFDWNCAQHITPRFTETEISAAIAPLRRRLGDLQCENAALRERLAELGSDKPPSAG